MTYDHVGDVVVPVVVNPCSWHFPVGSICRTYGGFSQAVCLTCAAAADDVWSRPRVQWWKPGCSCKSCACGSFAGFACSSTGACPAQCSRDKAGLTSQWQRCQGWEGGGYLSCGSYFNARNCRDQHGVGNWSSSRVTQRRSWENWSSTSGRCRPKDSTSSCSCKVARSFGEETGRKQIWWSAYNQELQHEKTCLSLSSKEPRTAYEETSSTEGRGERCDSKGTWQTGSIEEQENQNDAAWLQHVQIYCRMHSILLEKRRAG